MREEGTESARKDRRTRPRTTSLACMRRRRYACRHHCPDCKFSTTKCVAHSATNTQYLPLKVSGNYASSVRSLNVDVCTQLLYIALLSPCMPPTHDRSAHGR